MQTSLSRGSQRAARPQPGWLGRLFWGFTGSRRDTSEVWNPSGEHPGETVTITFADEKLSVVEVAERCKVTCLAGMVWITFQDRRCDTILGPNESLELRRKGKILISGGGREDSMVRIQND